MISTPCAFNISTVASAPVSMPLGPSAGLLMLMLHPAFCLVGESFIFRGLHRLMRSYYDSCWQYNLIQTDSVWSKTCLPSLSLFLALGENEEEIFFSSVIRDGFDRARNSTIGTFALSPGG